MRLTAIITALVLGSVPVSAQDSHEQGLDLMGEALRLFMQGLMQEMEPALNEMEGFLENLDAYHPPEVLPNGDIIIRRKSPKETEAPGETEI